MTKQLIVTLTILALVLGPAGIGARGAGEQERLPKHVTPRVQQSVQKGLEFLAKSQTQDGNWVGTPDANAYPITSAALAGMAFLANGNTPSRGPYADQVKRVEGFLMSQATSSGLITGPGGEEGRPMYGHGFSLMFLSCCYGMENDEKTRQQMKKIIEAAIELTSKGQSNLGGWTYIPGGGDEGSVTVTQMQGLRAAHNAGFTIPKGTIEEAVHYLERCRTPEGGIEYSFGSGGGTRLPITAAAVATLYNAGEYDSKLADSCLNYIAKALLAGKGHWNANTGHDFYTNLYASQAFYQAGDKYWDDYYPNIRDELLRMQSGDGSWPGDGIGPVYGTSIGLIILQLPYKLLPIYQR